MHQLALPSFTFQAGQAISRDFCRRQGTEVTKQSHSNRFELAGLVGNLSLWRNRLARSAVNRKVGGSSPPRDELAFFLMILDIFQKIPLKCICSASCQDGRAV